MNPMINLVLFLLIFPLSAYSQMHNCGGVWTNKPCDGSPQPEQIFTPLSDKPIVVESTMSMYRKLDLDRTRAKRQHGIELDISRANTACLSKEATMANCQKTVEELQDKLHERIQEAKLLEESKKQTKLMEERNQKQVDIDQLNNVTVYENDRKRHRPIYDRESSLSIRSGETELSLTERDRTTGRYGREEPFVPVPPNEKPANTPVDKDFKPKNRFQAGW